MNTPNKLPPHTAHKLRPHFMLLAGKQRHAFVQLCYTHHGFLADYPRLVGDMRRVFDFIWISPRFRACRIDPATMSQVVDLEIVRYLESETKGCAIAILRSKDVDYLCLSCGGKHLVLEAGLSGTLEQAIDYVRQKAPDLIID